MCQRHRLGGIGNQLAGSQRVFHADVSHGNAVTDADGRNLDGSASRHTDTGFYRLCDLVQMKMSRDNLAVGRYDADQRAVKLLLGIAESIEERTVRRALHALCNLAASAFHILYLRKCRHGRLILPV